MGYFGGCIYISCERVGISSRSHFPAFVFCFMVSYIFVAVSVSVFQSAMWSNLQAAVPWDDLELRSLADSLHDVALAGRAPSNATKYSATYARWKRWARAQGLPAFPASPYHFVLYLRHLMEEAKTAAPIESAIHAIAWVHHLAGERSPSEHPLVNDVLASAQRLLAHHTSNVVSSAYTNSLLFSAKSWELNAFQVRPLTHVFI